MIFKIAPLNKCIMMASSPLKTEIKHMKTFLYSIAFPLFFLAACSSGTKEKQATHSIKNQSVLNSKPIKNIPTDILLAAYLKLKNALIEDNDKNAASAGNELVKAFSDFDRSTLSAKQQKTYANIEDDAREHAEHIGKNAGNIPHQREHFDMLSKDVYDLIKLTGISHGLYVDSCPMYNNSKGAIWISEIKEIKNPYFGKAMPSCGSIRETIN
jgi:hypothetical protein